MILSISSRLIASTDAAIEIVWVDEALHTTAVELMQARPDKTYSLCDAVSFVLMRAPQDAGGKGVKATIELNEAHDLAARYATLCHEIAHIYLGHLGADLEDNLWGRASD